MLHLTSVVFYFWKFSDQSESFLSPGICALEWPSLTKPKAISTLETPCIQMGKAFSVRASSSLATDTVPELPPPRPTPGTDSRDAAYLNASGATTQSDDTAARVCVARLCVCMFSIIVRFAVYQRVSSLTVCLSVGLSSGCLAV